MKPSFLSGALAALACAGLLLTGPVHAATEAPAAATDQGINSMPPDDSLATYKTVIQASDGSAEKQTLILNNVANLLKYFGPDMVAIDVVAYGPGLRLFFKDNENAQRIKDLTDQGINFIACENTMKAMNKVKADLNPAVKTTPAGIVYILKREKQGWLYVRP